MNRHRAIPTIHLTVRPCENGQVELRMQHPEGMRTVLYLVSEELEALQQTLDEAHRLANPRAPKPRLSISLVRNKP